LVAIGSLAPALTERLAAKVTCSCDLLLVGPKVPGGQS
jgi:hypothetical protein